MFVIVKFYFAINQNISFKLVRVKGLEPPLSKENKDLNLARLPVPPHPQQNLKNTGNPLQIAHSIKIVVPVNPTLTDKENNPYTFLK